MKTKISPATVGMFVLGALLLFVVGFLSFGGSNIFTKPARFMIYFDESVSGLDPGAPIKFYGVRVGRVAAVSARYDAATKKALVQTVCEINRSVLTDSEGVGIDLTNAAELQNFIDRGLRAKLNFTGITGLLFVELIIEDPREYPANPRFMTEAIPVVRQTVNALDPNAGIDAIVPMERLVSNSVARQRFYAVMLGIFAGVAGLLAVIGIYGVLAYAVIQRTQEIGIRMALGAKRSQVLALVFRKGVALALIGIVIGMAGAAAGARYLQGMLFGIEPLDAITFAVVGTAFALVATVASYLPARRATEVDPIVALRVE